jgi:hypothetical protein
VGEGGDLLIFAVHEIAAAARLTGKIVAAMPSDSNALTGLPVGDIGAHSIDAARDFVSRNPRIFKAGEMAFLHQSIAVADAAGFNLYADLASARIRNISLYDLEITASLANLHSFHFRHI